MNLTVIAGARPNFVKIAPIIRAIENANSKGSNIQYRLVHTGQHYDANMSDEFFKELNIPKPDINLGCGGGTQTEQTAAIMVSFEKDLARNPADLVMVVGDVNSTMACSIVAKKMMVKVAHVEAGIRSWDLTMPEEINRMVTDVLSDYYFTTSKTANNNLIRLGARKEQIFFVGNVMVDTLLFNMSRFRKPSFYDKFNIKPGNYFVLTLHRPTNVDNPDTLRAIITEIVTNVHGLPVVFPIHPRTARIFSHLNIYADNLILVDPLGYLEFNYLVQNSKAVITDSGGVTEETTMMGIPCMTLRDNTERPETCTIGTNELLGTDPKAIKPSLDRLFEGRWKKGGIPELWDGKAAERIIEALLSL